MSLDFTDAEDLIALLVSKKSILFCSYTKNNYWDWFFQLCSQEPFVTIPEEKIREALGVLIGMLFQNRILTFNQSEFNTAILLC